ncbi:MAG TPA: hypothetical protein VI894_02750 [Candidatus Nanoarchaeia archaeon]|nr:hypothetical protein [Candidatus Nanoarchaeia archaeon]
MKKLKEQIRNSAFARSFSLDKKFWLAFLFDVLFILSLFLIIILFSLALNAIAQSFSGFDRLLPDIANYLQNENINPGMTSKANEAQGLIVGFMIKMVVLLALSFFAYVASLSFFEGKSWSYATGRFDFKKLLLINLIWNLIWMLLLIITIMLIKAEMLAYFIIILLIIYFYFSYFLYSINEKGLWRTIGEAFATGITKLYLLIIPFAIIILMILLCISIFYFISFRILIIYNSLTMIFLLFIFTWSKFYINKVIAGIK